MKHPHHKGLIKSLVCFLNVTRGTSATNLSLLNSNLMNAPPLQYDEEATEKRESSPRDWVT